MLLTKTDKAIQAKPTIKNMRTYLSSKIKFSFYYNRMKQSYDKKVEIPIKIPKGVKKSTMIIKI